MLKPWASNLHPLWKGATLKKWIGDNFENGSGGVFQKSLKMGVLFQTILKNRVHFQTEFEKVPHPVGAWVLGPGPGPPGPWPPGGVIFQKRFENYSFLTIV